MSAQHSSNPSGEWRPIVVDWFKLPVVMLTPGVCVLAFPFSWPEEGPVEVRPEHEAIFDRDRGLV